MSVSMSGAGMPCVSSSCSRRRNSRVFAANDSIWTPTMALASVIAASISSSVSGVPLATTVSPR